MEGKPLVGLTADYRSAKKDSTAFTFVARGYYDAIAAAGGLPVILAPLTVEEDIARLLDLLDAVVLVGGGDLNPNRDGFMMHPAVRPLEERRETFDRMLMPMIAERRIPVLGIGVGMQLINVQQGGNLFLHIAEDLPKALPHKDTIDNAHRHGLIVARNSLMERVYGDGEVRVNSMHHMAIDEVAPGFRVTATAPDGVIEAIESKHDDWFALGTQFHPEAESASALDQRIFDEFIEGVAARSSVRMVA